MNLTAYGMCCDTHDIGTAACAMETTKCTGLVPVPGHCAEEFAWCHNAWCWVDPERCELTHATSVYFPSSTRAYSYATCGYNDVYQNGRKSSQALRGKTLRVGFLRNSGGWQGCAAPRFLTREACPAGRTCATHADAASFAALTILSATTSVMISGTAR